VKQGERGERDPPVPIYISWLAHRQVVGEGHEADPRRRDAVLHGQRDGWDAPLFYGVADQPDGPVAKWSGGREQHRIDVVFDQFFGDFGGCLFDERCGVVDGTHKGEVARPQPADQAVFDQPTQCLEREDGV
jgi:hypothetical protein